MKLAKIWWDYDDERYSAVFNLFEEGKDTILSATTNDDITEGFVQQLLDGGLVGFSDPQTGQLFGLAAKRIVKIKVLEE